MRNKLINQLKSVETKETVTKEEMKYKGQWWIQDITEEGLWPQGH